MSSVVGLNPTQGSQLVMYYLVLTLPLPPPPKFLQLLILPPQGRMSRLNTASVHCRIMIMMSEQGLEQSL